MKKLIVSIKNHDMVVNGEGVNFMASKELVFDTMTHDINIVGDFFCVNKIESDHVTYLGERVLVVPKSNLNYAYVAEE